MVTRKEWGGSRAHEGVRIQSILLSALTTCRLQTNQSYRCSNNYPVLPVWNSQASSTLNKYQAQSNLTVRPRAHLSYNRESFRGQALPSFLYALRR